MKVFDTSLLVFRKNLKSHIIYGLTLLFSIIVCFIFFNFIDNPILLEGDRYDGVIPLSMGLPFIIILFSCTMILYASVYYFNQRNDEYAIMMISGMNLMSHMKYAFIQLSLILITIIPLSFIIGTEILFLLNDIIYDYLNVHHSIYDIPISTYLNTLYIIILLVTVIILILTGYIHRNSILTLSQKNHHAFRVNKLKKKSLIYIFIYLIGLLNLLIVKHNWVAYILTCVFGMLGAMGALKKCIPQMLLHSKKNLKGKDSYICLSHFGFAVKSTSSFISLITILITAIIPILALQTPHTNEYITGIISYVFIVILLLISIVYKLNIDLKNNAYEYSVLEKIGFTKSQLKKLILKENVIYFLTTLLIPLPYIVIIGYRFVQNNNLSISLLIILFIIYFILNTLSFIITHISYLRTLNKHLIRRNL